MTTPSSPAQLRPGTHQPLGATPIGSGTNFAIYSEHATSVSICLYNGDENTPAQTITLSDRTNFIWHGWIDGVTAGTRYGIRADGPYDPSIGQRFNAAKLLVDPYARAIHGEVKWGPDVYGYEFGAPDDDLDRGDTTDDANMPKCVVVDNQFDWGDDAHPVVPWEETVIYEAHVKGLTKLHPDVSEHLQGTYLGACQPAVIEHLQRLGVTAVEFLPVHAHVDESFVQSRGLSNYWGYSTLGFFAPHAAYGSGSPGAEVVEFKQMVQTFHAAGIEVILDVVYNHTTEGNHLGPTLSFKGLDNTTYYHLHPGKAEYYLDFTGTGNSLRTFHPQVLTLILDSLRYWVTEMHVDGFRFDLASTLGRDAYDFDPWCGLFDAIHQDPVLTRAKLIAEPWDIGDGGYQLGNFPVAWSEWNDKFRDSARAYWLHGSRDIAEMGYRLTGSSDVFEASGRGPRSSINLITAHDGFTLQDLVSYDHKHNEANGEDNRDGHDHNGSANHGAEGPTTDPGINALRRRQQRNLLATLLLSQGVPMLVGGDELGRTQGGNNNAYCQDNEISWVDWTENDTARQLTDFVARLTRIRREYPILRRRRFFEGRPSRPEGFADISWFLPDGEQLTAEQWEAGSPTLGLRLAGDSIYEITAGGDPIITDTLLMILHSDQEPVTFMLPGINRDETVRSWEVILDTNAIDGRSGKHHRELSEITVPGHTLLLMRGHTLEEVVDPLPEEPS